MKWTEERRKEVLWIYDIAHAYLAQPDGPQVEEVTTALGDALNEIERLRQENAQLERTLKGAYEAWNTDVNELQAFVAQLERTLKGAYEAWGTETDERIAEADALRARVAELEAELAGKNVPLERLQVVPAKGEG